jgi:tRNA threonylcarbamoyl adenosine modification protein (Sua5/YciO/YrdC/YwlC family)
MALDVLRNDGVIVYPSDTVYGLGVSPKSRTAIERIYEIKRISNHKLMSMICSDFNMVSEFAWVSNQNFRVMKRCWPGPFTFILPATKNVPKLLAQKRKTIGIRIPDCALCHSLVDGLGLPIITTSVPAGPESFMNNTNDIFDSIGNRVDLILDGDVTLSVPSTVVDLTGDEPVIIREGAGDISLIF